MSGDVQPRKRKDKKKKKDDLSVEEPRGTAAALGEGDVFIHSQQDHVTGGHWCAKIIFFSLLAVLITLIGLIILENRGLTELEANAVESRYSGVLEGWLEDAPDDDHHDEHTLDLNHHDVDEEDEDHHNVEELDHDEEDHEDEEDHDDEESHEVDTEADEDELDQEVSHEENNEADEEDEEKYIASNEVDSNEEQDDNENEENLQDDDDNEDVEEKVTYKRYLYNEDKDEDDANNDDQDYDKNNEYGDQNDDDDEKDDGEDDLNEDDDDQNDDDDDLNDNEDNEDQTDNLVEQNYNAEQNEDQSIEHNNYQYGDDDADDDDDDDSKEIKQEGVDFSNEILYDNDKDGDDDNESNEQKNNDQNNEDEEEQGDDSQEDDEEEIEKIEKEIIEEDADSNEIVAHRNYDEDDEQASKEDREADDDENDLQDQEDDDEPPLERITAPPAGKPFVEIEEEVIEKPVNTLAEEEEYEKRQEQLRREEEEAAQGSQTWLKLAVGGALLVATHAVLRRVTAPRDIPEPEEETREETPIVDRRMTITHEQFPPRVQESPLTQIAREIEEEVFKKPAPVTRSAPVVKQDSEEDVILKKGPVLGKAPVVDTKDEEKELYSDEEEEVEDDEEEEDIEEPLKEVQKKAVPMAEQKPTEDSEPEDVEIIDDEQIEEELEDEEIEDEEEISDVDDTELLTRLEAKYGRLPEPERFGRQPDSFGPKHKDGGNSIEDEWPGEPSDAYWRTELNVAEEELRQGEWSACERRVSAAALAGSGRARWLTARAADLAAEAKRDNSLLSRAIAAYLHLLKMNERLSDKKLLEVAQRAIDRIQFRGTYLNAEPIYRLLIRRFPDDVNYRNNLTVSFLMANRADLADEVLKETLRLWPNDRVALAHHGFVLKTKYNKLEEAVKALYKALEGDTGPANEPRFYYHLGDALLLLGRPEEAHEVHKRGAALGHFLSPAQRSLYNVPRLRSRPWWPIEETPYVNLARALESSWKEILKEGEAAKALYEKEKEGLKERGDWTQLDLFVRGAEIPGRCARAPVTCAIVRREAAAARCRRGQVKFSAMAPGTHVRAHVGPTNCRLRMHLGLSNTKDTYLRVDKETRQWQIGKTFLFDDSFEHEVWHNGTGARLVLIVDVWHPDLTAQEKRTLPAI